MDDKTIIYRLLIAFFLGGIIGIERCISRKPAGIKTHIMVTMGSALTMIFGIYISEQFNGIDPTRISAQVVSGIGFLGALCVFKDGDKDKDHNSILGLTTASSIWVVACIGLAVGGGFILGAVVTTALILFNLMIVPKIERYIKNHFIHREDDED